MDAVDQVLAQRARRQADALSGTGWMGLAAAVLLHLTVAAAALLAPRFGKPPQPFEFVPVQVIPAQALGVERPRGRPPALAPPAPKEVAPAPPSPAPAPPKPAAKPREEAPEPALQVDRRPPAPREKPKPAARETAEPAPSRRPAAHQPQAAASRGTAGATGIADVGKGEEEGRRGSAAGSALGTSAFGSAIAGLEDPDFGYGYYIDRLLQLIDANWTRPPLGTGVKAVIYFRIQRGGAIADLRVAESSGYNSFDLAALRAVQNAAPFPPLPASYRRDSLGVNLIVR